MAMIPAKHKIVRHDYDNDGDYDISLEEEDLFSQLVAGYNTQPFTAAFGEAPLPSIEVVREDGFDDAPPSAGSQPLPSHPALPKSRIQSAPPEGVQIHQSRIASSHLSKALPNTEAAGTTITPATTEKTDSASSSRDDDMRSPLVRFRTFPKKLFSVSDLTAGSWCELQYFYTLTKLPYGRKTRTTAMKEGTRVHENLENEVHTRVHVEIASKSDAFGLRLWNLVQGLRTMRDTGLTRELEVWGMVGGGNLVNGIIDGVSTQHPDPDFEEELSQEGYAQPSITEYFKAKKNQPSQSPLVYLTDIKTRGKRSPANQAQLRPAMVQLFLYHRFLSQMAAGKLDYMAVFRRYNLDPDEPFSDAFIAQMASLHDEEFFDVGNNASSSGDWTEKNSTGTDVTVTEEPSSSSSLQSTSDFLKYRTLREMLPLINSEMQLSFPRGAESVGRLLAVEYRYRLDGSLIDSRIFPMDDATLDEYLDGTLEWWKGEREPKGVSIEDAWKCQHCEFSADCTWRKSFDEERLSRVRQRLRENGRSKSIV